MAKQKSSALDQSNYAADYGYQYAFLRSIPEVYKLFQQAVAGSWDSRKFQAAVMNTKWYKTHGEAFRQGVALEKADPATFKQQMATKFAQIADMSASMGSTLSGRIVSAAARNAVLLGWDDSQVRNFLSQYITVTNGKGAGSSGDVVQSLQQTAWRNGVKVSDSWLQTYARRIAAGNATLEDGQRQLREQYAMSLAPGFEKELKSGMDLYDVASPYMQSMAQTLELNPADINLFDPTIRSALSAKGADGKPATKSLWEFEQGLRQDQRYMKTQNAQDSVMSVGHKVLQDMGLVS